MTRRLLLVAVAALTLAACGRKTFPVAPQAREPQPVSDLTAVVRTGAIDLAWTNPLRRVDQTRVRDLTTARVYRSEDTGVGEPKPALVVNGIVVGYTPLISIDLASPAPALVQGHRVSYTDREGLVSGRRYTYVVVTQDSLGRTSPPSRRAVVVYTVAPTPPSDVTAEPGDGRITLRWKAPERLADGSPVTGTLTYRIERAAGPNAPFSLLTPQPIPDTEFVDTNLENDRPYQYVVRTVRTVRAADGGTAVSEPTAPVTATPVRTTPPAPPRDLSATLVDGAVRLTWTASPAPDVAIYVVYRAQGGGELARIGSVPAPGTTFLDRDLAPGAYRYAVSAQDASSRGNESARSNEITVTVP